MKLRIKGNSLRLRVSRTDLVRLLRDGEIEETVSFAASEDAKLTYALRRWESVDPICVEYQPQRVTVCLSTAAASRWADDGEVGIYADIAAGDETLIVIVEKDYACIDGNPAGDEAADPNAFPNPKAASAC